MDDHTDEKKITNISRSRTRRERRRHRRRRTPRPRQRAGGRHDRPTDRPTPPPSTTCETTNLKTKWSLGSTIWCEQLTNSQGRRLVCSKWNHVVDPQTEQDIVETGKNATKDAGPKLISNWKPATSSRTGIGSEEKTGQEMGRRQQRTSQNHQRQQRPHERCDLVHHGTRWPGMGLQGKRHCKLQTQTTNTTHNPCVTTTKPPTLEQTTHAHTTKVHDRDEGGADDDDTAHPLPNNRATQSIVSEPHLLIQHRYRPTSFQVARGRSRRTKTNYFCTERISFAKQEGPALWLSLQLNALFQRAD